MNNTTGPMHRGEPGHWLWGHWYQDIVVIPDDEREFPETMSDDELESHSLLCHCSGCTRREDGARELKLDYRRRLRNRVYESRKKRSQIRKAD